MTSTPTAMTLSTPMRAYCMLSIWMVPKNSEKQVGNVLAAPVVEDQHIYVQSVSGDVKSFGAGVYNNSTRQGGIPQIEIHWWRELF